MKILIVEDEFASRTLLQVVLKDYGFCHVAANGREAIEAVQQAILENDPYDLICLDIMMPEVDGLEALREIRTFELAHGLGGKDGVKVIMTTAKGMPEDILGAFNCGCEAYIIKPIHKDELIDEIRKLGLIQEHPQR